jgi:hypothetical protein
MPTSFVCEYFLFNSVDMKRFLLLLFILCSVSDSQAQLIEHNWTRSFSSAGTWQVFTSGISITDIGYVYSTHSFEGQTWTGPPSTYSSNGNVDFVIVKTSKTQNRMWTKHIGGIGRDLPTAIEQLSNGDLIISGIFSDSVDFDPGQDTVWKVSQGQTDNFLLRLDKDGNYINCITFGGSGTSYVCDLQINENDEVFICGWYTDSLNLSPLPQQNIHLSTEGYSSYLSKFDSNLNYISSVAFEGNVVIIDIYCTSNQSILFTGYFEDTVYSHFNDSIDEKSSAGLRDVIFGEVDEQLNFISQKTIGSINDELGWHIGQLTNGSVVLQLNFSDPFEIENNSEPIFVEGLYASLGTGSAIVLKNTMLLCLSGDTVLWYKRFSGSSPNGRVFPQTEFLSDENGNLIASYYYNGYCNLGENNFTLIDNGSQRGTFLLKIDQVGNICWVRRIKAFSSGFATVCVLKLQGENLYAGGQFSGDVDFDLSIGSYYSYGSSDPFITKWTLHDQYLSTEADLEIKSQVLYPNPTKENLFLKELNITNLQIHDLSGREVNPDYYFNGEIHRINTAELSNGAYILSYEKGKSLFAERFVVQH